MSTQPLTGHRNTARPGRRIAVAAALALVFALAALTYWQLDPAAASRDAYAACAGQATAALHAQDPRVRQQALDTLTECAAQR